LAIILTYKWRLQINKTYARSRRNFKTRRYIHKSMYYVASWKLCKRGRFIFKFNIKATYVFVRLCKILISLHLMHAGFMRNYEERQSSGRCTFYVFPKVNVKCPDFDNEMKCTNELVLNVWLVITTTKGGLERKLVPSFDNLFLYV
jgi:hypothetical protein